MISNILNQRNLKQVLQLLSIGLLAYQIAKNIPNMLTLSLGSWMHIVFSVAPAVVLVIIIAIWNPSGQKLSLKLHLPSLRLAFPSLKYLIFVLAISLFCGLLTLWLITHFPTYILVGQVVLFGSMILMLVLGMMKPELGPAVFFSLYPFLMFAEARLSAGASWGLIGRMIPNMHEWLQNTLFGLENINIVLLMFTIGFLFFRISHEKQIGKTILDIPIILFLIWTFMSVITANDPLEGLRSYLVKWVFPVGIYYATFFAIQRTNGIREIKLALVALLFFSCLLTIQNAAIVGETVLVSGQRAKIWAVIAGQMGPWSVLILPIAFSFLLDRKEPTYIRTFCLVTIIMALIMAVWEMQRAVFLVFAVLLVLSFGFYHHKWRWHLVLYATLGIIISFSFAKIVKLIEVLRPSLAHVNPLAFSANLDRSYLFEKGWDIVKDNPFLGIGPGGFRLLHIGLRSPEVSSHNMFLEVALESGVIASVLFAMIIFTPIVRFTLSFANGKYRSYDHDLRPWSISLLGFYAFLMFTTCWNWGYGAAVFCLLGVVVGTMRRAESHVRSY